MKIAVRSETWKFVIHVPLRVLRWKCIGRRFAKSWKREHGASVDPDVLAAILPNLYTCLKDWKKHHGSLTLVDVVTEGTHIRVSL